jgi:hypothetical protein
MKIDKKDLLPCPFCGGEASVDEWRDGSLWSNAIVSWFSIGCSDCDYIMTFCKYWLKAIEAWNNRKVESPWIPMGTPPKEFKNYFVLTVYGTIKVDQWRQPLGGSWLGCEYVSHWMPIPTLPEVSDKTLWKKDGLVI